MEKTFTLYHLLSFDPEKLTEALLDQLPEAGEPDEGTLRFLLDYAMALEVITTAMAGDFSYIQN